MKLQDMTPMAVLMNIALDNKHYEIGGKIPDWLNNGNEGNATLECVIAIRAAVRLAVEKMPTETFVALGGIVEGNK